MKIEFESQDFAKCLSQVSAVVERKSTMPILGNVLLDASGKYVTITATDLETSVICQCPVQVSEEGKVCIPARSLMDIVRELPAGKARMRRGDNDWILLESGKAQFRVVGASADKFPRFAEMEKFSFKTIRTETLRNALERTAYAMSTDEMRYNLNGLFFEPAKGDKGKRILRVVATDGHRLAMCERELSDDENLELPKGIILPRKGVTELRRLVSGCDEKTMEIAVTETAAAFRVADSTIFMRLVVGEFPDYNAVIPKTNKKRLVMRRDQFTESLRRVSVLSEGKTKCVKLGIRGNGVHLTAASPELGEAEEDVQGEFTGGELDIGFNARYLLDTLSAMVGDKISVELDQSTSPGLIRSAEQQDTLGVIMPMRI